MRERIFFKKLLLATTFVLFLVQNVQALIIPGNNYVNYLMQTLGMSQTNLNITNLRMGINNTVASLGNPTIFNTPMLLAPSGQYGFYPYGLVSALGSPGDLTINVSPPIAVGDNQSIYLINIGNDHSILFGLPVAALATGSATKANQVYDNIINTTDIAPIQSVSVKNGELILTAGPKKKLNNNGIDFSDNGIGLGVLGRGTGINNPNLNSASGGFVAASENGLGVGAIGDGTGINNPRFSNGGDSRIGASQNGIKVGALPQNNSADRFYQNPNQRNYGANQRYRSSDSAFTENNANRVNAGVGNRRIHAANPNNFTGNASDNSADVSGTGVGGGILSRQTGINNRGENNAAPGRVLGAAGTGVGTGVAGRGTGINNRNAITNRGGNIIGATGTGIGSGVAGSGTGINNENSRTNSISNSIVDTSGNGVGVGVAGRGTGISNSGTNASSRGRPLVAARNSGVGVGAAGQGTGIENSNASNSDESGQLVNVDNVGVGVGAGGQGTGIRNTSSSNNKTSSTNSNRSLVNVENAGVGVGAAGNGEGITNTDSSSSQSNGLINAGNDGVGVGAAGSGTGVRNTRSRSNFASNDNTPSVNPSTSGAEPLEEESSAFDPGRNRRFRTSEINNELALIVDENAELRKLDNVKIVPNRFCFEPEKKSKKIKIMHSKRCKIYRINNREHCVCGQIRN